MNMFKRTEEAEECVKRADPAARTSGFKPCLDHVQTGGLGKFI